MLSKIDTLTRHKTYITHILTWIDVPLTALALQVARCLKR
jgi:hypothetical protein